MSAYDPKRTWLEAKGTRAPSTPNMRNLCQSTADRLMLFWNQRNEWPDLVFDGHRVATIRLTYEPSLDSV